MCLTHGHLFFNIHLCIVSFFILSNSDGIFHNFSNNDFEFVPTFYNMVFLLWLKTQIVVKGKNITLYFDRSPYENIINKSSLHKSLVLISSVEHIES